MYSSGLANPAYKYFIKRSFWSKLKVDIVDSMSVARIKLSVSTTVCVMIAYEQLAY